MSFMQNITHSLLVSQENWSYKAALKMCPLGCRYRKDTVCVGEEVSFKLQSEFLSHSGNSISFSPGNGSSTISVSANLTGWLSCSFSLTSAASSSSGCLILCTMKRCLLRDNSDVKHRPQWRHWGVFSSVLCWGICCWNCVLSSVMNPHFEQRNCVFIRFAEGASSVPVGSCPSSWVPTAGLCNTSPCD